MKRKRGLIVLDVVTAAIFGVLCIVAIAGVCVGAWWQWFDAAVSGTVVYMCVREAGKELRVKN
jgi:hypothetical protein